MHTNAGLCGDLVSVGSVGTSYGGGIDGTNLGNCCGGICSPPPSPPPSPPSPPPPSPPPGAAGLLQPALWLNPYNGYTNTYQSVPGSNSAFNPVVFDVNGASISGDANVYSYLGPRFHQQVPADSTVTAVVEIAGGSDNQYVAFSTSPNPPAFNFADPNGAGPEPDRVVFVSDADSKQIYSTSSLSWFFYDCWYSPSVSTWSLTFTDTTVTWTDSVCGTASIGMYPIRFQPASVLRS